MSAAWTVVMGLTVGEGLLHPVPEALGGGVEPRHLLLRLVAEKGEAGWVSKIENKNTIKGGRRWSTRWQRVFYKATKKAATACTSRAERATAAKAIDSDHGAIESDINKSNRVGR